MWYLILAVALGATPAEAYPVAYEAGMKDQKPIVILLGATWCAPCQALKKDAAVMAALRARGHFAYVDIDAERELTKRLGVQSVPTVVYYERVEQHWVRRLFAGPGPIRKFLSGK